MSKQKFGCLDVLLRVQSGRLRVSDACVLIGLQRRQVFRRLRASSKTGPRACLPNAVADPATIGPLLRYASWHCRSCASDTPTLARPAPSPGQALAAEKLTEHHGCSVSCETLRGWTGWGRTIGIVSARRISRAGGTIA
jgi:hypothetical protein